MTTTLVQGCCPCKTHVNFQFGYGEKQFKGNGSAGDAVHSIGNIPLAVANSIRCSFSPTTKQIAERDQRTANLETKLAKLELAVKKAV